MIVPEVVMRPILSLYSVNQRFPSGPAVMPKGRCSAQGGELGDRARGGDPADLADAFREPQVPIGARRDVPKG